MWMRSNKSYVDPSWVNYYSMYLCVCVHDLCKWKWQCLWLRVPIHCSSRVCMYSINSGTPADGWLVLIHSREANLSRQLDSLTDLTADNSAGSVRCNNPGKKGGYFVWKLSAWDTMLPRPQLLHTAKELVIITGSKQGQRVERAK